MAHVSTVAQFWLLPIEALETEYHQNSGAGYLYACLLSEGAARSELRISGA